MAGFLNIVDEPTLANDLPFVGPPTADQVNSALSARRLMFLGVVFGLAWIAFRR